jgi:hypothetical protein
MLKKYTIEYSLGFRGHVRSEHQHHYVDEAVACEDFVRQILERGLSLHTIRRDGAELPPHEFARIVKVAAAAIASDRICASLNIKSDEAQFRFGFAV